MDGAGVGNEGPGAAPDRHRSRWRKPPAPPRDRHWFLGVTGRVFITTGLLILAFVVYQLWGTGIEFRAGQSDLRDDFRAVQSSLGVVTTNEAEPTSTVSPATSATATTSDVPTTPPATTVPAPTLPPIGLGDVVGALRMPSISSTTYYVVAGVRVQDLKRGVGHYPGTPLPGEYGNAALAGHRTTYGAPFEDLDRLKPGDRIIVDTILGGHYEYVVESTEIIKPTETRVLSQPDDRGVALLTLTTCHPKRSTKQRLVVHSRLDAAASSALGPRTLNYRPVDAPTTAPTTAPASTVAPTTVPDAVSTVAPSTVAPTTLAATTVAVTTVPVTTVAADDPLVSERQDADDLARGWFHDGDAWPQLLAWGALLVAISYGIGVLGRGFGRRWPAWLIGAVPFMVVLYFVFQNLNRLLPPGL